MDELSIMLIVSVIEVGKLRDFNLEELSEFESALRVCVNDEYFFATLKPKQQQAVKDALKQVDNELTRRGCKPVNFFQLMEDDPAQVEYYLKQFKLLDLLDMAADLKEYKTSKVVEDLLKMVNRQIYNLIPVA